ncbi:hypothetical protein HOL21_00480 [Candidatus Woesearchaeota archaeon]|jgi:hypothetical protein|nr:hypothetical protein [Candidatus Woesearchaeota archaeon]MBT5396673.1 hypothetical protein [Candidatus Woesearchaeota archaeon]MBT5924382.1 hypothetical protein [Candidatus Woesearchaeota archaeon]MBT6367540.1 hypothetical protein [Candidatus Woesearchaeota archaeon]MBT7763039.1 hypothetical protein [Candidatus Woesearchaeota archaeon]
MNTNKVWVIVNISLVFVAALLFLTLIDVNIPTLGNALYEIDGTENVCIAHYKGQMSIIQDTDRCCLQMQQQVIKGEAVTEPVNVDGTSFDIQKTYYTSESVISYFVNMKTYRYCKNNGFWI